MYKYILQPLFPLFILYNNKVKRNPSSPLVRLFKTFMVMFSWRKMGNCLAHICVRPPFVGSCIGFPHAKHEKVLQVVKTDGKVLESRTPILVKDISVKFSGSGIGLTKKAIEHLPPSYELKPGNVYYILPPLIPGTSPAADREEEASGVKRIKVVITKQQLQQLLTKEISFEEVLLGLERKSSSLDSPRNWKPKLESIPEGFE